MDHIQLKSHRIIPALILVLWFFLFYVCIFSFIVSGFTLFSLSMLASSTGTVYWASIEFKETKIFITSYTINFLKPDGKPRKTYFYEPENIIVKNNAVYLLEKDSDLQHKKIFSLWWTDTSQSKLTNFFEYQKTIPRKTRL